MTSNGHGPCSPFMLASLFTWGHHCEEAVDHELVGMRSYSCVSKELVRGAQVTQRQGQPWKAHPAWLTIQKAIPREPSPWYALQSAQQVCLSSQELLGLFNFEEGFCESSKFEELPDSREFLSPESLLTLWAFTSFPKGCHMPIRINC